ncbi:hypothetical protein AMAG_17008 [Allomyces macrogynus ATCC 38327]|uniref:Uncharacterized protein n=1 Tax=Allomyces macrogynus (strain ATCC 38327) TaxID=578462 RepID=A0A0L0TD08_ALLM3|nr:hypothetical protein AMAG_17008 [Allomyces macrogynus ATCC 38327]|eukprot:KNE72566.1 hypothetical protein AMAG_17008 [Allomyces macrogynus ATCC 38327]
MSVIADKMRKTWSSAKWFRARGNAASKVESVSIDSLLTASASSASSALTLAGCSITLTAFGHWPAPATAPTATISRASAKRTKRSSTGTSSSAATAAMQPVLDAWAVLMLEMHGLASSLAPFTAASIPPFSGLATPPDSPVLHGERAPAITAADRVLPLVARGVRQFLTRIVDPQLLELWAGCVDGGSNSCPGRADGVDGLPRPAVEHLGPFFRCVAMAMVAVRASDVRVLSTESEPLATPPLLRVLRSSGHALVTDLARLLHLDLDTNARWTHAVDWDQVVVGLALRWFKIKAVCPFAALVEPQRGAGMDPRLCVVDGGEAEVVEYCVVPALVDLAVDGGRGVLAKARVVGAPMGVGTMGWSESASMSSSLVPSVE